ncbi:MAG: hypothetical protein KDK36_16735 [Leptospiraceae bacterium]|nr:hypothetical protein [Leptospiraceae bacterium]
MKSIILILILLINCQTSQQNSNESKKMDEVEVNESDFALRGYYLLNDVDKISSYLGFNYNPKRNNSDHKEFCVYFDPKTNEAKFRFYKSDFQLDITVKKKFENTFLFEKSEKKRVSVWYAKDNTKIITLLTSELTGYSPGLLIFDELSKEDISEKGRINKKTFVPWRILFPIQKLQ